jgi:hypothetical protein
MVYDHFEPTEEDEHNTVVVKVKPDKTPEDINKMVLEKVNITV